jgi:hypothetical protein
LAAGALSLVGVIVGVVLTKMFDLIAARRGARDRFVRSRDACESRLSKVAELAKAGGNAPPVDLDQEVADELMHLGPELDAYISSAADPSARASLDENFVAQLRRVLLLHDLSDFTREAPVDNPDESSRI